MTGKENLDEEVNEDEYFGFCVDAGMGCVAAYQTRRRPLRHTGPSGWKKTRTSTLTTICSAIFWRKTPKPTQNIRGSGATGSTGRCRTRTVVCPSLPLAGATGTIPFISATMPRAKSVPCMYASSILKPATRSRNKEAHYEITETGADSNLGKTAF